MAIFDELIEQLSERLDLDIFPDSHNVVTLLINQNVKVQIQTDSLDEYLIIGATIAELPPGKFREHILRDSLKANYLTHKNPGTLSYMEKNNVLMLHLKSPLGAMTIDQLIDDIKTLSERAKKWMQALDEGRASPLDEIPSDRDQSNKSIFGF